jgi:subtilisin family serine protease
MYKNRIFSFLAVIAIFSAAIFPASATSASSWQDKVDPWVLQTAAAGETEFLVFLAEQADLSQAAGLETKLEKGTYVYQTLTEVAARTQGPILDALDALGVEHRPYWVANMVWVRAGQAVVEALASRPDVGHIYANPKVRMEEPSVGPGSQPLSPDAIEWNILKVGADLVWAEGYTGQGAVIGGQDTGYDWDHPALKDQYRGWDGATADHNYNWHDAIHSNNPNTPPGNPCGFDIDVPCDDQGHGTHTMGTMVGDDGGANQIGMAPGARWIGCRNMEEGWGMPSTYTECYQWFIAPTDLNDQNPDPAMAPHAINNSWSCPPDEGCNPDSLLAVVQSVRAAGIVTAHSAGNGGPGCSTVNAPAAIYDESFSVGATDINDNIASFSSRGPVTVDGSNRMKPEISAPGSNIRSSLPGTGYGNLSGTSMAAPHVAGLVGLLISAQPSLAGEVDEIETLIQDTALPRTTTQ